MAQGATAQPTNLVEVATWPQKVWEAPAGLEVQDHKAYLAGGYDDLTILDISQTNELAYLGGYDIGGKSTGIWLVGGYAYLAEGTNRMHIIDVGSPTHPVRVAVCPWATEVSKIKVAYPYAYSASGQGSVKIVDVQNPAQPRLLSTFNPTNNNPITDLEASASNLFIARFRGLDIVDVNQPTNPIVISRIAETNWITHVFYASNYVYFTQSHFISDDRSLFIYDISNPSNPIFRSSMTIPQTFEHGEIPKNLIALNGYAFLTFSESIYVYNVKDPIKPLIENLLGPISQYSSTQFATEGQFAYSADWQGLYILRLNAPFNRGTSYRWFWDPHNFNVTAMDIHDNKIYLSGSGRQYQVLDIQNPSQPISLGNPLLVEPNPLWSPLVIRFLEKDPILAESTYGGITLTDISQPTAPVTITNIGVGSALGWHYLAITNQYLYAVGQQFGLRTYDLEDPKNPKLISTVDSNLWVNYMRISGPYLCLSGTNTKVFHLDNPRLPEMLFEYPSPPGQYALDTVIFGDKAFIAMNANVLEVIDWRSAAQPQKVKQIPLDGSPRRLSLVGQKLYVATDRGIQIIDTISYDKSRLFGGSTSDIHATSNYVFAVSVSDIDTFLNPIVHTLSIYAQPVLANNPAMLKVVPGQDKTVLNLELIGQPGEGWEVQASTNLTDWVPFAIKILPPEGKLALSDPGLPLMPQRYYRAISQ